MNYTDEQIEEAARILSKEWNESDAMYCRYAVDMIAIGRVDKFNSEAKKDIESALRQAVERKFQWGITFT